MTNHNYPHQPHLIHTNLVILFLYLYIKQTHISINHYRLTNHIQYLYVHDNDNLNNLSIIEEEQSEEFINNLVGLFDPEVNDLSLDLWSKSDGSEIKKIFIKNK